ncbi:hypothetical protein BGX31_000950, partial [Mortierella sp. GBA43]
MDPIITSTGTDPNVAAASIKGDKLASSTLLDDSSLSKSDTAMQNTNKFAAVITKVMQIHT